MKSNAATITFKTFMLCALSFGVAGASCVGVPKDNGKLWVGNPDAHDPNCTDGDCPKGAIDRGGPGDQERLYCTDLKFHDYICRHWDDYVEREKTFLKCKQWQEGVELIPIDELPDWMKDEFKNREAP